MPLFHNFTIPFCFKRHLSILMYFCVTKNEVSLYNFNVRNCKCFIKIHLYCLFIDINETLKGIEMQDGNLNPYFMKK